ncbi:MAG TPA: formimidoylglutamate deiminase [Mycobacteriales bacterium]|nr:formimidoylglutamate deiminase [Mycobacteriales bacterium]
MSGASWWCEHAWLGAAVQRGVLVGVDAGRIQSLQAGVDAPPRSAQVLRGLVLPGLANTHSHAFHRALRGRTQRGRGSFWTWREQMYELAGRLDPDSLGLLATAVFAEMALAGVTAVGEFHYVHHHPNGQRYDDPNAMSTALIQAAQAAGVRITLLDTCYLAGGFGQPAAGVQARFSDGDAAGWAERVNALQRTHAAAAGVRVGAAIHSVRAVPADQIGTVARWAADHEAPLHVHLSEQQAENADCLAHYGRTPTQVLHAAGALGPRTTAVHATHLTGADIELLGGAGCGVCLCPTTERDLADGIGPARRLFEAGASLSLGSDGHFTIDLFEEARATELDERLATEARGHWSAAELLTAASAAGQASLGWPDAGELRVGARADLVALRLDSVRTAGCGASAETAVFAGSSADVTDVVRDGVAVVTGGRHLTLGDVAGRLTEAVGRLVR